MILLDIFSRRSRAPLMTKTDHRTYSDGLTNDNKFKAGEHNNSGQSPSKSLLLARMDHLKKITKLAETNQYHRHNYQSKFRKDT